MTQFLLFCFLPPYSGHKGPGLSEEGSHLLCSWLGHELSKSERGNRKACWGLLSTLELSDPVFMKEPCSWGMQEPYPDGS